MRCFLVLATFMLSQLAHAEPAKIGVLSFEPLPDAYKETFLRSLREQGLTEGKDVAIDWRNAEGKVDRANQLAAELVQAKPKVIVGVLTPSVTALTKATQTIPIVMAPVADPVATGFVKSLAHPGGNVTGISNVIIDLGGKLLGLLREIQPSVARVAVIVDSRTASGKPLLEEAEAAGKRAGIRIVPIWLDGVDKAAEAFKGLKKERVQAVMLQPTLATKATADLAREYHLLSIATGVASRSFPRAGGLIGYGSDPVEHYRRAGVYVAKILRGAKPGDIPVEQATTFELIINAKTAKALGLTIPKDMLVRANEVIE